MNRRRVMVWLCSLVMASLTCGSFRLAIAAVPEAPAAPGAAHLPPQPAPAPPAMPPARAIDAVLADIVQALGGADHLKRHKTMYTRVQITFRGLGMSGTAEHFAAEGDRALTLTSIPGLASTREGCDGHTCWSEEPINGLRILEGAEAEQARLESVWNPELRFTELFTRLEVRNERDRDGAVMECLVLTPKESGAWTNCYDASTHLLILQRVAHAGPQGTVPFTSRYTDWRKVDDIAVPYFTEMQAGPLAFTGTITSVEIDRPVDVKGFAVPIPPSGAAAVGAAAAKSKPGAAKSKVKAPKAKIDRRDGEGDGDGEGEGARDAPGSPRSRSRSPTASPPAKPKG